MGTRGSGWLRDNAFLAAAVALPAVVVGLFVLSTALPRRLVDPPRYDAVLSARAGWDAAPPVTVSFHVRDGRVEADVEPARANVGAQRSVLYLFDHRTETVREIPVVLPPGLASGGAAGTVVVEALGGRRVVPQADSPDGYALRRRPNRGPGLIGEIFGMRSYDDNPALEKAGRIVPLHLPAGHFVVGVVGWVEDGGDS